MSKTQTKTRKTKVVYPDHVQAELDHLEERKGVAIDHANVTLETVHVDYADKATAVKDVYNSKLEVLEKLNRNLGGMEQVLTDLQDSSHELVNNARKADREVLLAKKAKKDLHTIITNQQCAIAETRTTIDKLELELQGVDASDKNLLGFAAHDPHYEFQRESAGAARRIAESLRQAIPGKGFYA